MSDWGKFFKSDDFDFGNMAGDVGDWLSGIGGALINKHYANKASNKGWKRQLSAMQFSADQAEIQRAWQERMSNTAHQREVADLRAAGLNPVLSATGGNGASTPSGGYAAGSAGDTAGVLGKIGEGFSSLGGAVGRAYKRRQMDKEMQLLEANAKTAELSVREKEANVAYINANTAKVAEEAGLVAKENARIQWIIEHSPSTWFTFGKDGNGGTIPALSRGLESMYNQLEGQVRDVHSGVTGAIDAGVKKAYNAIKDWSKNNASSANGDNRLFRLSVPSSQEVLWLDAFRRAHERRGFSRQKPVVPNKRRHN